MFGSWAPFPESPQGKCLVRHYLQSQIYFLAKASRGSVQISSDGHETKVLYTLSCHVVSFQIDPGGPSHFHCLWSSFQSSHWGVLFSRWLLISGSRDNHIQHSGCPDVFLTRQDTTHHQWGGNHHRIACTRPLDLGQEVDLLETSRHLFPNWLATSLSESIHLEISSILCLPIAPQQGAKNSRALKKAIINIGFY